MSIFSSKKPKPREVDVDRSKQRPVAGNNTRPQPNGNGARSGTANGFGSAALSAGARTIQRAQIMAASRKRMNGETPDYSIQGATKSNGNAHRSSVPSSMSLNAAKLAVGGKSNGTPEPKSRSSHTRNKLSKDQQNDNDERKSRAGSMNTASSTTTPIYAALSSSNLALAAQKPVHTVRPGSTGSPNIALQKTPPLSMDSPTLGYDGSFTKSEPPTAPVFSSGTPLSTANGQAQVGASASQDVRVGRLSRNDSGFGSRGSANKDSSQDSKASKSLVNVEKAAGVHPGVRAESKMSARSSRSSTFVSKLDPGPSCSAFAEPVESPQPASMEPTNEETTKRPRQASQPQKFQLPDDVVRNEKSSGGTEKFPPLVDSPAPRDTKSKGLNRIVAASQARLAPQTAAPAPQYRRDENAFTLPVRSSTPPATRSPGLVSPQDATARTYTLPAASPPLESGAYRTAPTSKSNSPPQSPDSKDRNTQSVGPSVDAMRMFKGVASYFGRERTAAQEAQSPVVANPSLPQPATTRSSISEPRPALPPVSVLEGFKVNKRGHVLDEEGEVIGELFEGDLIDCVRQKVDANGDVLDESGEPVGRVRTIVKGTVTAPRWSISSGVSLPLSTYNWGRRDSTASQHTHQTHQTFQSQQTFFNRTVASPVPPPTVEGNAIVAELDASTDAEAGPLIDQSEIFSPFGAPARSESPTAMELAADERPKSGSTQTASRRGSVAPPDPPITKPVRKWTSRYFEQSPLDGQPSPRRNSATPDMVHSPTSQSIASPKTTSIYGAVSHSKSRAVIGPTLESLMEQDPTLFTAADKANFGGSTPNLIMESPKASPTISRPASAQFGPPAPGLGSRLSVKGPYQPARRSPLGSYETTPPGSGGGLEDEKARARSLPPAARRIQKHSKASMEAEDAAPAPEISRTKWQEKRAHLAVANAEKTVEKRKSRFSFRLPAKKEVAAA